jgi:GxxExxY protein
VIYRWGILCRVTQITGRRTPIVEPVTNAIIASAIKVHQRLGPGLLESTYRACLTYAIRRSGLTVISEPHVDITFDDLVIPKAYRLDLVVNESVVVEIKHVEKILALHEAQLRTYLRLSGINSGLLLNFNTTVMKNGIRRIDLL